MTVFLLTMNGYLNLSTLEFYENPTKKMETERMKKRQLEIRILLCKWWAGFKIQTYETIIDGKTLEIRLGFIFIQVF